MLRQMLPTSTAEMRGRCTAGKRTREETNGGDDGAGGARCVVLSPPSPTGVLDADWEPDCLSPRARSWSPEASAAVQVAKRRAASLSPEATMLVLHSGMVTSRPASARLCRPVDADADDRAPTTTVKWEGMVKHRLSSAVTMELFGLSLLAPHDLAESFPPTLFVASLRPAEACQLDGAVELEGAFLETTGEHRATVAKMGEMKMAVAVELQDCRVWICPQREEATGRWSCACLAQRTM